jgi:hypothetical protein
MMNNVKSLFAGLAAAIIYVLSFGLVVLTQGLLPLEHRFPADSGGVFSNGPWIPLWPILMIGAPLIFLAAFYWTFKRISKAPR